MEKSKPKVFITGSAGFIGQAIMKGVLSAGYDVQILIQKPLIQDDPKLNEVTSGAMQTFEGTLADPNAIAIAGRDCPVWIHAAGISRHRASKHDLEWTHIAGTENVIQAAKFSEASKLIFISCADVIHHNADRVYWNEDRKAPMEKLGHFARTKLLAEELVQASGSKSLSTIILRPARVWGPGDPSTQSWIDEEKKTGLKWPGNGEQLYCTTYIDHLVDAVLRSAERSIPQGSCLYVTDGELQSIQDFMSQFSKTFSLKEPKSSGAYISNYWAAYLREKFKLPGWWTREVIDRGRSTYFDDQRARTLLGYAPFMSLEEGMQKTWNEYQKAQP